MQGLTWPTHSNLVGQPRKPSFVSFTLLFEYDKFKDQENLGDLRKSSQTHVSANASRVRRQRHHKYSISSHENSTTTNIRVLSS